MAQPTAKVMVSHLAQIRPLWMSVVIHAVLGFWSLVCLFPLYWVVVTSLKGAPEINDGPYYLPFLDFSPNLHAWSTILTYSNDHLLTRFYNSAIVAIASTFLTVLSGGMAVCGLTRFRYEVRWARLVLLLLAAVLVVADFLVSYLWMQLLFILAAIMLGMLAWRMKVSGPILNNEGIVFAILATRILPPIVVV